MKTNWMTTLPTAALLLLSSPAVVGQGTSAREQALAQCQQDYPYAQEVMRVWQLGASKEDLLKWANNDEERVFMVESAFQQPRFTSGQSQLQAISDFGDWYLSQCKVLANSK
ncbi:hypothetical protein DUD43_09260 [Alcaligenes faecalis]|uniref:hypothetical protein n=1 Tax=Alcaligenes faecalis TaxID=511 RepID=UPI001293DCCA|nr:hypothetical protein [Alcaligenes faecalis]MBX6964078.1 hypothetical protein [Providencia rettgeri]MBX7029545.1 hypothetical protein [Alcaligenes faecalis]QFY77858.1 hypothetical protein DUD43_09260 [Alcaligenes faecalis]